jgi:hypothetical protein
MSTAPNAIPKPRAQQLASLQKVIDGLNKHAPDLPSLVIAGTTYKTADVLTVLKARIDALNAVVIAKATWQNAVKADFDERAKTKALLAGLRQALLVAYSGQVDHLADFGLVGRKPAVITPEKRVVAIQKAKATRAARHTMGKKQKGAIHGAVPSPGPASGGTQAPPPAPPAGGQPPAPAVTPTPAAGH